MTAQMQNRIQAPDASPTGASTNTGWFALIVALMCIPFGGLLLSLGIAKWFRRRSLSRTR